MPARRRSPLSADHASRNAELRTLARTVRKLGVAATLDIFKYARNLTEMHHWILDEEGEPKTAPLEEWARWFETSERTIARDDFGEGLMVSTVFLGIDHAHGQGPPILYETMIFGGRFDLGAEYQVRASTREEALLNHRAAVVEALGSASAFERDALATRARVQRARKAR